MDAKKAEALLNFTKHTWITSLVLLFAMLYPSQAEAQAPCTVHPQNALSIEASQYLSSLRPDTLSSQRRAAVDSVYAPCAFQLLWSENGALTEQARQVMIEMGRSDRKGLHSEDYGMSWWGCRAAATEIPCTQRARELGQFDVDLTAAALRFASDLAYGRARPHNEKAGYISRPDPVFLATFVRSLSNAQEVSSLVSTLEPSHPGYRRAEKALSSMADAMKDMHETTLPDTIVHLTGGQTGPEAHAVNQRLAELSYLPPALDRPILDTMDATTLTAIHKFQQEHGLQDTGTINRETVAAMNVPLKTRAEQLALTLERWRWVPHQFSAPPLVVNIPEFRVRAYNAAGEVVLSMPVVVGRTGSRRTPMLQATLERVIFHPYWNVPANIAAREIAPHATDGSSYLSQHEYQVIDRSGKVLHSSGAELRRQLLSGTARIRQLPGAQNALGNIKFEFPNTFNVYLHGTPQQALFAHARRDFSHGCIRVEDPAGLAAWVLRTQEDGRASEQVATALADPRTRVVPVPRPIPVLVVYGTGIAAEDGSLRFFTDVYGFDASLRKELEDLSARRKSQDQLPWAA